MEALLLILFGIEIFVFKQLVFEHERKQRRVYYRNDYLKSDAWQRKRYVVLKRDNWRCVFCGGRATQVHHKKYANIILVKNQSNGLFQYANLAMTNNITDKQKMPNPQRCIIQKNIIQLINTKAMHRLKSPLIIVFLLVNCYFGYAQPKRKFVIYNQNEIVLQNARIVDVEKGIVLEGYSLVILNGKISGIGKTGQMTTSKNAQVIDVTGKTILPGLVMLHEHMNYNNGAAVWHFQPVSFPKLFLAAGVTTVRTAGAENPMYDLNLKRQIDSGTLIGPRIFVTGPMFNDVSGGFLGDFIISNYEEGRKATAFWAEKGCTSFKVYSDISKEALSGVIAEAHARGLKVTGHLGKMSCTEAANLGIDNIEHSFGSCSVDLNLPWDTTWNIQPEQKAAKDLVDLLLKKNIVLTITPFSDSDYRNPAMLEYFSIEEKKRIEKYLKDPPPFMPKEINDRQLRPLEKLFINNGGKVVLGADAADCGLLPGFQNHNAMVSMVKAGWTSMNVIKMATIDGANFLNIQDEAGSIAIGKNADLLIVSGKPDQTIEDIKNVELVFRNGIGYDSKVLREFVKGMVGRY